MTPLRSYSANEVRELADATCRELKRASDAERQERLEEFKFRSRGGAYGARSGFGVPEQDRPCTRVVSHPNSAGTRYAH